MFSKLRLCVTLLCGVEWVESHSQLYLYKIGLIKLVEWQNCRFRFVSVFYSHCVLRIYTHTIANTQIYLHILLMFMMMMRYKYNDIIHRSLNVFSVPFATAILRLIWVRTDYMLEGIYNPLVVCILYVCPIEFNYLEMTYFVTRPIIIFILLSSLIAWMNHFKLAFVAM